MSPARHPQSRVCSWTGFGLTEADGGSGWRVAKDVYVGASGINGVLVNDRVGVLPPSAEDARNRYDTIGRTVYFADSATTALAEVLQSFRVKVMTLAKDADAIGMDVDAYRRAMNRDRAARGLPAFGEVDVQ